MNQTFKSRQTMKRNIFTALLLSSLILSACGSETVIALSGKKMEKTYEVSSSYSGLEVSGAVHVMYSSSADEVTVMADSSVIPYVYVEESGNTLKVYMSWKQNVWFRSGNTGKVSVIVPASPSLGRLKVSGASCFNSDVVIEADRLAVDISGASDFNADLKAASELTLEASGASGVRASVSAGILNAYVKGASDMSLSGNADSFNVTVSGTSSVSSGKAYLETDNLTCEISGASDCHVKCNVAASGKVSGASSLVVYGDGKVNVSSSGASSVKSR